jgi:hypothetical protein
VDEFFRHPWLDLDAYQGSIVIGPDDEPEGILVTGKLTGRGIFMNYAGHYSCLSLPVCPIATQDCRIGKGQIDGLAFMYFSSSVYRKWSGLITIRRSGGRYVSRLAGGANEWRKRDLDICNCATYLCILPRRREGCGALPGAEQPRGGPYPPAVGHPHAPHRPVPIPIAVSGPRPGPRRPRRPCPQAQRDEVRRR